MCVAAWNLSALETRKTEPRSCRRGRVRTPGIQCVAVDDRSQTRENVFSMWWNYGRQKSPSMNEQNKQRAFAPFGSPGTNPTGVPSARGTRRATTTIRQRSMLSDQAELSRCWTSTSNSQSALTVRRAFSRPVGGPKTWRKNSTHGLFVENTV